MPSFVTHWYFAAQVRDAAPPAIAQPCTSAADAFFWGSQGPDPFFFDLSHPKTAGLGGEMHRNAIYPLFSAMAAAAGRSPAALAYLLGFCTHYALDRTTHPYIESQSRRLMASYGLGESAAHKLCEADLDAAVLLRCGKPPATCAAYRFLNPETPAQGEIARMLAAAGRAAGGSVLPRDALRAMRGMYAAYRLIHEGRGATGILSAGERLMRNPGAVSSMIRRGSLLPEDSLNTARRVWLNPSGRPRTDSFEMLMEGDALALAGQLQRAACAAVRRGKTLPEDLFPLDYSGRELAK